MVGLATASGFNNVAHALGTVWLLERWSAGAFRPADVSSGPWLLGRECAGSAIAAVGVVISITIVELRSISIERLGVFVFAACLLGMVTGHP